jgi:hypothetical protein
MESFNVLYRTLVGQTGCLSSDGLCTKSRSFKGASKNRVTLKALANVSPGWVPTGGSPRGVGVFALKPWVQKCREIVRNPERDCAALRFTNAGATPSELRLREMGWVFPGLTKRNPGLELANAFSVRF